MFKNNYIKKLAFDNIRRLKHLYRFVFASLLLVFILTTTLSLLFSSFEDIGYHERYQRYGKWSVALENPTEEQKRLCNRNPYIDETGIIYHLGTLSYQDQQVGSLQSVDDAANSLLYLTMIKGRMPENEHEIVLEEDQLFVLGITDDLNQTITFTINNQVKQYQLVGIMSSYSQIYPIPLSSYLTANTESSYYTLLFNSDTNYELWNQMIQDELEAVATLNLQTYNQYIYEDSSDIHYHQSNNEIYTQILIFLIGLSGVLGTMISTTKKREQYLSLMRAIGATPKQIRKMVVFEGILLSLVAAITGILLGVLISGTILGIYAMMNNSYFSFMIPASIYYQLGIAIIVCMIGILLPSFNAYSIPLTGKITQKVQVKKVRKVHDLKIHGLALQEITQHRLANIILVIALFLGIFASYCVGNDTKEIIEILDNFKNIDNYDYILYKEGIYPESINITDEEIKSLISFPEISAQVIHSHEIYASWDELEEIPNYTTTFSTNILDKSSSLANAQLLYYDNKAALKEILNKYNYEGPLPKNDNEILLIKPHIYPHDKYGTIISIVEQESYHINEYYLKGLEVGNELQIVLPTYNHYDDYGQLDSYQAIEDSFKIVGTATFESLTEKEKEIFDHGLLVITNKNTYRKYIDKDDSQKFLFDINDKNALNSFKQTLLPIVNKYSDFELLDTYAYILNMQSEYMETFLKNITFIGLFFIGVITLIYIHRKIYILSLRHEISLYRAVGMTNKQIYQLYFLYSILMSLISFISYWLIGSVFQVLTSDETTPLSTRLDIFYQNMFNYSTAFWYLILFGLFISVVLLPVYHALKDNILTYMKND